MTDETATAGADGLSGARPAPTPEEAAIAAAEASIFETVSGPKRNPWAATPPPQKPTPVQTTGAALPPASFTPAPIVPPTSVTSVVPPAILESEPVPKSDDFTIATDSVREVIIHKKAPSAPAIHSFYPAAAALRGMTAAAQPEAKPVPAKPAPQPPPAPLPSSSALRGDVADVLGKIKLPERIDLHRTMDFSKAAPQSSAPIKPASTAPLRETPIKDLQQAAREALPPEWRDRVGGARIVSPETSSLGSAASGGSPYRSAPETAPAPRPAPAAAVKSVAEVLSSAPLPIPQSGAPMPAKPIARAAGSPEEANKIAVAMTPGSKSIEQTPLIHSLHTLKDDMQELIKVRKMSLVKAVALEGEKKQRAEVTTQEAVVEASRRRRLRKFIATVAACITLGGLALYAVAYVRAARAQPSAAVYAPSFMFAEQTLSFPLEHLNGREVKSQLSEARTRVNLSLGAVARIVPTVIEQSLEGDTRERPARATEFLKLIAPTLPEELLRTLGTDFFFGVHAIDENAPLLVLPVGSYQDAFAAMLQWESTMNEDLSPLFTRVYHEIIDESGAPILAKFEDLIVRNYDVRALKDARGEIQMLYAFPTREILIITESPHSFVEALARLRAERRI